MRRTYASRLPRCAPWPSARTARCTSAGPGRRRGGRHRPRRYASRCSAANRAVTNSTYSCSRSARTRLRGARRGLSVALRQDAGLHQPGEALERLGQAELRAGPEHRPGHPAGRRRRAGGTTRARRPGCGRGPSGCSAARPGPRSSLPWWTTRTSYGGSSRDHPHLVARARPGRRAVTASIAAALAAVALDHPDLGERDPLALPLPGGERLVDRLGGGVDDDRRGDLAGAGLGGVTAARARSCAGRIARLVHRLGGRGGFGFAGAGSSS